MNPSRSIIYGVSPVLEALKARTRPISRLLVADGSRSARITELLELARSLGIPFSFLPRRGLDREAGSEKHQGIIAVVAPMAFTDFDELLSSAARDAIWVLMDSIEDPRNLGAIIRSAHCAGAAGVIVPKHHAAALTDVVQKTSAGALEYLPVARITNVATAIEDLKKDGYTVIGVEAGGIQIYSQVDLRGRVAFVMGGEGAGLRRLTKERCDMTVRIPMAGKIGSLNVAVAAGILLFEAVRQRRSSDRL